MEETGIGVRAYDPRWPELYRREAARLGTAFGLEAVVEHIGSTSVPGLDAKPIVDILVGVRGDPRPPDAQVATLACLGYEFFGEDKRRGRRWMFRYREKDCFNLSVVSIDSDLWRDNVLIRDFLRSHPEDATRYAAIKAEAARVHPDSLLAYQNHKRAHVDGLRALARASAPQAPAQ